MSFLKAILEGKKGALKVTVVNKLIIPNYSELSVKDMYDDVMQDGDVAHYLPEVGIHSSKFPERDFFFGVLGTVKSQYLQEVIRQAHSKRYCGAQQSEKQQMIAIKDEWIEGLLALPYFSSKIHWLTLT